MIYKPKYFSVVEIFPKAMAMALPDDYLWAIMDSEILIDIDTLREYVNKPIFVNYGNAQCRGFRDCDTCKTIGAKYSAHRYGMALDFNIEGMEVPEVRELIIKKQHLFPHIRRMEIGRIKNGKKTPINWIHVDVKPTNKEGIYLFYG